jgi:hypothetical protein
MKKSLIWLVLLCVASFAQEDAPEPASDCNEEKDVAKAIYEKCVNMDRETDEYAECAEEYKEQKLKAEQACRAAAPPPAPAPVVQPKAAAAPPKPVPLEQKLSGIGLSSICVDDFADVLGERGFSMTNFAKELVPEVAKVKLKLKSPFPFGKPKDGDVTSVGLRVGCIKSLPESPVAIQSLLKDVSLKAGLNFAAGAMDPYSIPSNVGKEVGSGGGALKASISTGLITAGVGVFVYGILRDSDIDDFIKKKDLKSAKDAEKSRNISYGVGAGLLASGLSVVIFF